jgi:crotonobetainyl-CoA:carnitine CoA-transferase CaiB-like acyl-CoA transferase
LNKEQHPMSKSPITHDFSDKVALLLTVNSPFGLDGVDKTPPGPAPGLGQHGEEVLREAGFDTAEICRLRGPG